MAAELLRALLALAAVLAPLAVAWAVVEGPRWWALWRGVRHRHALARRGGSGAALMAEERHR
ncbi:hypothetical protein [Xylophilus sp. Leaf220]|jgi:hypothetical protein|uniref:hypothetical protein n=1 Tax=Xylophilus sp. Leaf220 TaxID=1735686 RepID=UPI0006F96E6C|nr:hypothetical protein [Xylophilus sp. Leaf220]KQM79463.1 hypothetical protein ASE76_15455 [Xylophilus sp. Leaf220]